MQLHSLLQNIKDNKPVNFDQVVKRLPAFINWSDVFNVEVLSTNKYAVEIKDPTLFNILFEQSKQPLTRAQAASATSFSSHDIKCESAYMLCFPAAYSSQGAEQNANKTEKTIEQHSDQARVLSAVAVSQQVRLPMPFPPAKQAILIENQDCFFQYQRLLNHYESQVDLAQSDIYFAGGLRILNNDLRCILEQYSHINCLFDYDLVGVQMALSLRDKLQHPTHTKNSVTVDYLILANIKQYAPLFTFLPNSTKSMASMLALCRAHSMHTLADVVNASKHFMEQEALLTMCGKA